MDIERLLFTDIPSLGFVETGLKAGIVLAVCFFVAHQHEMAPSAVRHRIWAAGMISLALLPVLSHLAPSWPLQIPLADAAAEGSPGIALPALLVLLYISIAALRSAALVAQIADIAWQTSRSREAEADWYRLAPQTVSCRTRIRLSSRCASPLTWGALRPVILLPASADHWPETVKTMVLKHELAHIHRGDWLIHLVAGWVSILYWPVPGIRTLREQLSLTAEQACDDQVLATGVPPADYAALLLQLSRGTTIPASVALARPSQLGQRVRCMLSCAFDHSVCRNRRLLLYPVCVLAALPMASLELVPTDSRWIAVSGMAAPRLEMHPPIAISTEDPGSLRPRRPPPVELPPDTPFTSADTPSYPVSDFVNPPP